jgi:hypothetical protein
MRYLALKNAKQEQQCSISAKYNWRTVPKSFKLNCPKRKTKSNVS